MRTYRTACLVCLTAALAASTAYGDPSFGTKTSNPSANGSFAVFTTGGPAIDLLTTFVGLNVGNTSTLPYTGASGISDLPGAGSGPMLFGPPPGGPGSLPQITPPPLVTEIGGPGRGLGFEFDRGVVSQLDMPSEDDRVSPVPAPGAAMLAVLGFGLVGWIKRRLA